MFETRTRGAIGRYRSIRSKLVADGSLICPMLSRDRDGPDPKSICVGATLLKSGSANLMFGGMGINSRPIVLFGTNAEIECIMEKLNVFVILV